MRKIGRRSDSVVFDSYTLEMRCLMVIFEADYSHWLGCLVP